METLLTQIEAAAEAAAMRSNPLIELAALQQHLEVSEVFDKEEFPQVAAIIQRQVIKLKADKLASQLNEFLIGDKSFVKNPYDDLADVLRHSGLRQAVPNNKMNAILAEKMREYERQYKQE